MNSLKQTSDFTNGSDDEEVFQWNPNRPPKTPGKSVEHLIRLTGLNQVSDESDEASSSDDAESPKAKKRSKHEHNHVYPYGYNIAHALSHHNCKKHKSRSHKRKKSKSKKHKPRYPSSANRNSKSPPRYSSAPTWERVFQPFNIPCVSPQIRAMKILQEMQIVERETVKQNTRIKVEAKVNQTPKPGHHVQLASGQSTYGYCNMYLKPTSESIANNSKGNITLSIKPGEIKMEPKIDDEDEMFYSEKYGNLPIRIKKEGTNSSPVMNIHPSNNSSLSEKPRLFEVKIENDRSDRKVLFGPRRGSFIRSGQLRSTKEVNKYIPLKEDINGEESSSDEIYF